MEPARNPLAAPENTPKRNFATRPKCNFDQVNCSDDQTRVLSEEQNQATCGAEEVRGEKVKQVYTAQVHNLVTKVACPGFETKRCTNCGPLMDWLLTWDSQTTCQKARLNATLSITDPTWTDLGLKLGLMVRDRRLTPEPWHSPYGCILGCGTIFGQQCFGGT